MVYYVGKILQYLLQPLVLTLICLGAAIHLSRRQSPGKAFRLLLAAFFILLLPSLPAVPWFLIRNLEGRYPSRPIGDYPKAEAILVLGGTATQVLWPRMESEELGGGRLLGAARLYRSGKAKRIVVLGGPSYIGTQGTERSEALDMKEVLMGMGVPGDAVVAIPGSRNTQGDAGLGTAWMHEAGVHSALLVTSALHMRRAMALFQRPDLDLIPVPVGRETVGTGPQLMDFLPDGGVLGDTDRALKEHIGYWVALMVRGRG